MDLFIKETILKKADITAEQLLIEIAVYLYEVGRLTMGQARSLAGLDHLNFQKELGRRDVYDVYIKYDIEDLKLDMENLKKLRNRKVG